MRDLWDNGILQRILILFILIAFLGISPLPYEVQTGFEEGRRALEFGSLDEFAKNLAFAAEHTPWRTDLWEQAGRYALAGNDPEAALEYFKQAAARGELSQNGFISFGDAYHKIGNDYTAAQIWEVADQRFGPSEEIITRLADVHRSQGDYTALVNDLKALIDLNPTGIEPANLYYEAGFILAASQPESAPPYLLQAVDHNPEMTDASALSFAIQRALPEDNPTYTRMAAGQKLAELGKWDLAAQAFGHAIIIQPGHAEAWAFLGEALQHKDHNLDDALAALQYAVQLDNQSLPANTFLALYWQRMGEHEKSLEYLKIAADIDPANPAVQSDLGAAYAILGDFETAQSFYQRAIELEPNEIYFNRVLIEFFIRYNIEIRETALPLARELVTSAPDDAIALDVMGQVLFRLGDVYTAERFYLSALTNNPNYAPAHLHLGILYNFQGEEVMARDHLSLAITLAPNSSTAEHAQRILQEN